MGAVLLSCGLLAGYTVGRSSSAAKARESTARPTETPTTTRANSAGGAKSSEGNRQSSFPKREFNPATLAADLKTALAAPQRKRWQDLRDLARSIAPADAIRAMEIAKVVMPRNEYTQFRFNVLERWAEQDHASVLVYAQSLKNRQDRQMATSSAITEWARKDADAALEYVEKMPRGSDRQQYYSAMLRGIAETSPQKAMELLNKAPGYERRWIRNEIVGALADSDPKAAAELALGQYSTDRYSWDEGRLGTVLEKWMRSDPDAAVAWLAAQPENVRKRQGTIRSIQQMGWAEPQTAARLVELIPAGPAKENAMRNLLNNWAQNDLEAVKSWADQRSDPQERLMGQMAYAQGLMHTDPAKAAASLQGLKVTERSSWEMTWNAASNRSLAAWWPRMVRTPPAGLNNSPRAACARRPAKP